LQRGWCVTDLSEGCGIQEEEGPKGKAAEEDRTWYMQLDA
jgi:hypothetical protein